MKKIYFFTFVIYLIFVLRCYAGVIDSLKSGYEEGKRILKGEPEITAVCDKTEGFFCNQDNIKSEGSLINFTDNNYMFKIALYNSSSYVVTEVKYEIDIQGDKYKGELNCGAVEPNSAGSCQGVIGIFKMSQKWGYSATFYGYKK